MLVPCPNCKQPIELSRKAGYACPSCGSIICRRCVRVISEDQSKNHDGLCWACVPVGKCAGCGGDVDHFRVDLGKNSQWHGACVCYYMMPASGDNAGFECTKEISTCFQKTCTGRCLSYKPRYKWDEIKLQHVEIDYTNHEPLPVFDVKKLREAVNSLGPSACDTNDEDGNCWFAVTVDDILATMQKAKRKSAIPFVKRSTRQQLEAKFSQIIESE